MNKRHYNSEETRSLIADKAGRLFAQKGFAGTSIADISRESGCSKGHIYYHFENKEKLFVYLALETMRSWKERWEAVSVNYGTAVEKLYAMASFVQNNYKTPLLRAGQELGSNPAASPETVTQLRGLASTPMQAYNEIFRLGMETGEFELGEEDLESTGFLFGTLLGGLCQYLYTMENEPLEALFQRSVTIFVNGISRKG
ncbi:TetR family transcriptional regulator C-terminal domain-containing protein [Paenibacillus sonchi]|uniref:TetR family transcriptional regulator C-terminal domain-containing protein n=1 Tax=Paenibacillus sonchi TaxID=373687 RepID=UPI001E60C0F7|nr:TetR family transcriptional regulator C-terminal domain-containing protein [Paenibacillus sonchi]MCE3202647.1 TetR/AcrR family transcriptional regulator [Paenibacillus sonchi]